MYTALHQGVGGFVEEYHTLMGRSRFCLAPRGITPWTIHLFVSMLAGCIPVPWPYRWRAVVVVVVAVVAGGGGPGGGGGGGPGGGGGGGVFW